MFKERLTIDIMKRNYSKIQCVVGDTLTLEIELFQNSYPFILDGYTIIIEQGLDNNKFNLQTNNININQNLLTCTLSDSFTSKSGKHFIDISLSKDEERKTTFKIPFDVYNGAIEDSYEESEIVITVLEDLKRTIIEAEGVNKDISDIVKNSSSLRDELTELNSESNRKLEELESSLNEAETTNNQLDSKITEGNNLSGNLQALINQSNSSISEAESANSELSSTIVEAKEADNKLQDLISQSDVGNLVKREQLIPIERKVNWIGIDYSYPTFNNYRFDESGIGKGTNTNAELGSSSDRFKNVYVGSNINQEWGYTTLTNGITICWGNDYLESSSSGIIEKTTYFKNSFKNTVLNISLTLHSNSNAAGNYDSLSVCNGSITNESFTFRINSKSSTWNECRVYWFAIGF